MPKRRGITNNPKRREKELNQEYSVVKNFKIEKKIPDQKTAQEWENKKPNNPGGPKAKGPYTNYRN